MKPRLCYRRTLQERVSLGTCGIYDGDHAHGAIVSSLNIS